MTGSSTLNIKGCNPECKFGVAVDELKLERENAGNAARDIAARNIRDVSERNGDYTGVEEARERLKQLEIDYVGDLVLEAVRKNCQQPCAVQRILAERPNFGAAIINKMATLKDE